MTEGDISRMEKIIHLCDDCKFATCEQCEINYGDVYAIKHLYEENKKQQKEIENSVSKDKIEEYLKEAEEKYQVYKKGVKDNEALKSGMWKHLGEVDVLKRILGKQRNVVTLDNKLLGE